MKNENKNYIEKYKTKRREIKNTLKQHKDTKNGKYKN